jgi:hypothetical protein
VTKHENRQRWHFILFIVKIKIQLQHYKYENKINITSEIISPLGNLELFQEQIQQGIPTILPTKKPYEDAINLRKEKKSFRLTKKISTKKCFTLF